MIDDNLIEHAHQTLQNSQEAQQSNVFTKVGHVSWVDPTTNLIKVVVPDWTNDNQTYMETGPIQLGTPCAGNQYGIQLLPFGQATVTDVTGEQSAQNGNTPMAEQVLVHILGRKRGLYVQGVQMFNQADVPPSGYQDKSGVKANAGEWLFKHSSGGYLYFANQNSITLESYTNPAPVVQTNQTPTGCTQDLNFKSTADGRNTNTNNDNTNTSEANINVTADSSGGTTSNNSNVNVSAQNNSGTQAQNTASVAVDSTVTSGSIGQANLDLKANSKGATSDNAEFTLEAATQSVGQSQGTINIDAGQIGTGQLDINVKGITGTLNVTVDGTTNEMTVTVTNGIVNVITDIVNVDCEEANITANTSTTLETGTLDATCTGTATVTAPQANIFSEAVILGNGTAEALLNNLSALVYNEHTHEAPGGVTGPPNQPIDSASECKNVFGS